MSVALGRGAAALAFSRALLFPTMALPRSPWWRSFVPCLSQRRLRGPPSAALCCASRSPTIALGTSTPAPDWFVPYSSPKLPLLAPSGAGRGLWWLLVRVPLLRALCGQLREVGGGAVGEAAQNRARRFGAKRVCPESAALGFPPPAGVAPYPLSLPAKRARRGASPAKVVVVSVSLGQHRARSTARAAFGYSLAEGTLQGRCWDTSRMARESFSRQ